MTLRSGRPLPARCHHGSTADAAAKARGLLKAKQGATQLNAAIDREVLSLGAELAVYRIEAGVRRFADVVRAIAADLDMDVARLRPYARSWCNGPRDMIEDAGLDVDGMDSPDDVRAQMASLFDATPQEDAAPPAPEASAPQAPVPEPAAPPAPSAAGEAKAAAASAARNAAQAVFQAGQGLDALFGGKSSGRLTSGIGPEMIQDGITLAGFHVESGAHAFADYARAMIADLGDEYRPYLRSWYEGVRYYPGFDATGMTPAGEIPNDVAEVLDRNRPDAAPPQGDATPPAGDAIVPADQPNGADDAGLEYAQYRIDYLKSKDPAEYRRMKKAGTLNQHAEKMSRLAVKQISALMKQGFQKHEAEEYVLPETAYAP